MSNTKETPPPAPAAEAVSPPAPSMLAAWMTRMKLGGFVLAIVAVECAIAYFLLPSTAQTAAMAEARLKVEGSAPEEIVEETHQLGDTKPSVEVDLGKYSVTAYQPAANVTLRIDFHLYGTVYEKEHPDFVERYSRSEHRLRERVLVTVRNAEVSDLTDAGLGLLKRRILETTNRSLGKPLLQAVVFSDFSFIEQ